MADKERRIEGDGAMKVHKVDFLVFAVELGVETVAQFWLLFTLFFDSTMNWGKDKEILTFLGGMSLLFLVLQVMTAWYYISFFIKKWAEKETSRVHWYLG